MLLDKDFVMQGGVRNYLGKTEEVTAPKYWQSSENSPPTELSYITEPEKNLLLQANLHGSLLNNQPNIGAAGLLSYDGWGDSDRGTSDASYGGGNVSGGGDNRDYGGSQEAQERSNRANELIQARKAAAIEQARQQKAAQQKAAQEKAIRDKEIRQAQIRQQEIQKQKIAEQKRIEEAKRQDDARLDYITGKYLDVKLNPEQKKEFEQYRTGVRESISPSTKTSNKIIGGLLSSILPGAGSLYNFYLDSTAMGYEMPNPFENLFGGGGGEISLDDVNNLRGGDNGSDSNARSQLVQSITQAINPNLPDSQVDQYFSNMNMPQGSPLSSDLQTDYNNAKNSINSILGITPPSQQFGYSADPYGGLMASNLTTNPYNIDYLKRLGLI